jgi:hypothetical protein
MRGYPVFKNEKGSEYKCLAFAVSLKNGWEWFGFDLEPDGCYFGFVHGFEDEYGYWSPEELRQNGVRVYTDPTELQDIMPPIGWTRVTA